MKKQVLVSLIFVCTQLIQAQVNCTNDNPFKGIMENPTTSYFGETTCWSYFAHVYVREFDSFFQTSESELMHGDTIINNIQYKKFNGINGFAAIRESGQKIYAITIDQQDEFLLYDFGLNVGEAISTTSTHGLISRNQTVSSVDSIILYNGEKRKRIKIGGDEWIEGIGSKYGFLHPCREFVTCNCNSYYELISFANNKQLKFYDAILCSNYFCCEGLRDDVKRINAKENIFITYNQGTKTLNVTLMSVIQNCTIQLLNLNGKLIFDKQLCELNTTIKLSNIEKGLYLFRISDNNKVLKIGKISNN